MPISNDCVKLYIHPYFDEFKVYIKRYIKRIKFYKNCFDILFNHKRNSLKVFQLTYHVH